MKTCAICGYIIPCQGHSGECPHCLPSYQKAVSLIREGKIWSAFRSVNYVPTYDEWECIHSIEVAGAKEKQSTRGAAKILQEQGFVVDMDGIERDVAKIENRTRAAANFEINRIIKLRTAKKPTPEEAKQAAAAEQAFYDSTYTS